MALKNKYIKSNGDLVTGYYRVHQVLCIYEKGLRDIPADTTAYFDVHAFNLDTDDTWERLVENKVTNQLIPHDLSGIQDQPFSGLIVKAYEQLKTLNHFSDAIDC